MPALAEVRRQSVRQVADLLDDESPSVRTAAANAMGGLLSGVGATSYATQVAKLHRPGAYL